MQSESLRDGRLYLSIPQHAHLVSNSRMAASTDMAPVTVHRMVAIHQGSLRFSRLWRCRVRVTGGGALCASTVNVQWHGLVRDRWIHGRVARARDAHRAPGAWEGANGPADRGASPLLHDGSLLCPIVEPCA
jgi:hypothetical protein